MAQQLIATDTGFTEEDVSALVVHIESAGGTVKREPRWLRVAYPDNRAQAISDVIFVWSQGMGVSERRSAAIEFGEKTNEA